MSDLRGEIVVGVFCVVVLLVVCICQQKFLNNAKTTAETVPLTDAKVEVVMYKKPQYAGELIKNLPVAGEVTVDGKQFYLVGDN